MTLAELSDLLGGHWVGALAGDARITGASTLVTRLKRGQIFFIMDAGHWSEDRRKVMRQFGESPIELAERAYGAGAAALVASSEIPNAPLPVLVVEDSRRALWQLGRAVRRQYRRSEER